MKPLLADGIAHHRAGRLSEAEGCYRHILEHKPGDPNALHLLGVLIHQQGNHKAGEQLIRKAIALEPNQATFHNNLADTLRAQGDLINALSAVQRAIELNPNAPEAYQICADLQVRSGHFSEAETALRTAVERNPKNQQCRNALALFLSHNKGAEASLAVFRQVVDEAPNSAAALANYGQALLDAGQADLALEILGRALANDPQRPEVWNNFGNVFRIRSQSEAALAMYRRALALNPNLAMVHSNIGVLFAGIGRYDFAEEAYRKAISLEPDHPRHTNLLAGMLTELRRHDEALALHKKAIDMAPHMGDPLVSMASCLIELNRYDEALPLLEKAQGLAGDPLHLKRALARWCHERGDLTRCAQLCREVLKERPHSAGVLHLLVSSDKKGVTTDEAAALAAVVDDPGTTIIERCNGAFSLASLLDERKDYASSARLLKLSNALQAQIRKRFNENYSKESHRGMVDRMIQGFSKERLEALCDGGYAEAQPIYILGMPRSGTTLTEQIISGHPEVYGAGELNILSRLWDSLPSRLGVKNHAEAIAALNSSNLSDMGKEVAAEMAKLSNGPIRITDKLPDNYLFIGFITALFPKSSIIYVQRDLRDVATSCYQTHFGAIRWANDVHDIAWRCQDHVRIMKHWQQTLGDRILTLPYESTVADLESSARRLLEHCGLAWNPTCLDFHTNDRAIKTASVTQVRQPIYTKSVEKWRHYSEFLPELYADIPTPEDL